MKIKNSNFKVTFWGVRGSHPVPGINTTEFGGNTPCVELNLGGRLLILDAGTGIIALGNKLSSKTKTVIADILITHNHWDHIQGFPFFKPAFKQGNHFNLYGTSEKLTFKEVMKKQMTIDYFPIQLSQMGANLNFYQLEKEQTIDLNDGIIVKTFANNHTTAGVSFRINFAGKSCCYITDYEHSPKLDNKLVEFIKSADLVIYDSHFTNDEYHANTDFDSKVGWGHSTWQEGIKHAQVANAKQLIFFHHAPSKTDQKLKKIETKAQKIYPNSYLAKEGLVINL